jgi:leader peptidase (prepilin peptidase)/N-methyltransferase
MTALAAFVFGLVVGSFLNVCIVRLPRGRSIAMPPSHCPRCREPIRFYDNIPIVSFLLLRGKCRSCGVPISWRYPSVELLNGLFYAWTVREFGLGGEALLIMALCSALIVITFIDYDHQIIPDAITLPGMLVGLSLAPFFIRSPTRCRSTSRPCCRMPGPTSRPSLIRLSAWSWAGRRCFSSDGYGRSFGTSRPWAGGT